MEIDMGQVLVDAATKSRGPLGMLLRNCVVRYDKDPPTYTFITAAGAVLVHPLASMILSALYAALALQVGESAYDYKLRVIAAPPVSQSPAGG